MKRRVASSDLETNGPLPSAMVFDLSIVSQIHGRHRARSSGAKAYLETVPACEFKSNAQILKTRDVEQIRKSRPAQYLTLYIKYILTLGEPWFRACLVCRVCAKLNFSPVFVTNLVYLKIHGTNIEF